MTPGTVDTIGYGASSGRVMAPSPDGATVYASGASYRNGAGLDIDLIVSAAATGDGAARWIARYTGTPEYQHASPRELMVTPDGRYVVVFAWIRTGDFKGCALATLAFDATTGQRVWDAIELPSVGGCMTPQQMAIDPAGRFVFVTGSAYAKADSYAQAGLTVAYALGGTSPGQRVWSQRYSGSGPGAATYLIAPSPDGGRVYVVGTSHADAQRSAPIADLIVLAYDSASGAQLLQSSMNAIGNTPAGLVISPDGASAYVVTGVQDPGYNYNIATIAFATGDGRQLWRATYDGPSVSSFDVPWYAGPIVISPDGGRVFVTGYGHRPNGQGQFYDFVTLAYETTSGALAWQARYADEGIDWFPSIAITPRGDQVFVAGWSQTFGTALGTHAATVAYDAATGGQVWVARDTDGYTVTEGAAVSRDGSRLFIGAMTTDPYANPLSLEWDQLLISYALV